MSKEEILELLDELTNRLEGPAAHVFELAVRNTLTGAILGLVASVLFLIGGGLLVRLALRKIHDSDVYDEPGWVFLATFAGIGLFVASVFVFITTHTLLNVEFQALRSLVPGL